MGRGSKQVLHATGIDRRVSGYYSTPRFVADFMAAELMRMNPHAKRVLDPCAGQGELQDLLLSRDLVIDSFDVVDFKIPSKSNFRLQDFIEFYEDQKAKCILGLSIDAPYDIYIANPPYNCHEVDYIQNRKSRLKGLFPQVGVHNMYSMFISAMIDCAKDGALIGFITLDSFLTGRVHHELRQQILKECSVHTLVLCPTDLFLEQESDVRTCIMILQKGKRYQGLVSTSNRSTSTQEFRDILNKRKFVEKGLSNILLTTERDLNDVVIGCPDEIFNLFHYPRLGQMFRCVTGISTGEDKKYISKERTEENNVPFYKNPGNNRFRTTPNGYLTSNFLEIEKKVSDFQVRNKDVLFKEGITCSSMGVPFTACYLPPNCTFGVNANIICEKEDLWWLMSYLNSSLVTFMVRGVLIRTNMITSGYVSRIPITPLSEIAKRDLFQIARREYEVGWPNANSALKQIDSIVYENLRISAETQKQITEFCSDLIRLT